MKFERLRSLALFLILVPMALTGSSVHAQDDPGADDSKQIEFFESKVRPLLVNRCFECHSGTSQKLSAGLRLDSRVGITKGGDSGPAMIPGSPDKSLLIQAVRYEKNEMPPNQKLSSAEIAVLEKWVESGAVWPKETLEPTQSVKGYDWDRTGEHWAFQPIIKHEPPAPEIGDRIRNPIDQFVIKSLRDNGLPQPASTTPRIFVRRVFIDLIGLLPTPSELEEWVSRLGGDTADELDDDQVSNLIDSLLDRPQYGERWGRHWLDVARYSEVGGWTQDDAPRPKAWQYRDWVVKAFNSDMPFDEFVRRQIVGDKFDRQSAVGTGIFALGPSYSSDGGDPESIAQARGETLDDRVDTFSRAFLGLTVACARCHDHKFDPIPTQDYYSIAGVFNNTREVETPLVDDGVVRDYEAQQRPISELRETINKTRQKAEGEKRPLSEEEKKQVEQWEKDLEALKAKAVPKYEFAHTIQDASSNNMHVALRGNLLKPGELAPRRFLRIISGDNRPEFTEGSGRRQLAEAVVEPANPLTPRVIVNRVWQNHFGQGLVRTPDNFGMLGEKPTHPELLDWLSSHLIESGWSIKSLHRIIMSSATYRSSSRFQEAPFAKDGDNRSLWRMNPRRMEVETWRDSLLEVTNELDTSLGGPSIDDIIRSRRRTLYAKVSRNDPLNSDEFLRLFDFPMMRASSAKRTENVIPQQFLFMMNSQFMRDRANALALRLKNESDLPKTRIERGYALLFGRAPTDNELHAATQFLESNPTSDGAPDRWQQYCQVLLSSNEFMYVR